MINLKASFSDDTNDVTKDNANDVLNDATNDILNDATNDISNDGFCLRKEDCENDLHLFATNVSNHLLYINLTDLF